jgi:hypothetical protein
MKQREGRIGASNGVRPAEAPERLVRLSAAWGKPDEAAR